MSWGHTLVKSFNIYKKIPSINFLYGSKISSLINDNIS